MKKLMLPGVLGFLISVGIISYYVVTENKEINLGISNSGNSIKNEKDQDYIIGYVKELLREEEFEIAKSEPKRSDFVRVEYIKENGIKKDVKVELTKGQRFNLGERVKVENKNKWEADGKAIDNIEIY
ncbi:hypothetical protein [Bacillus cereus group sp. BfR-BA-01524]|uniref:hypothetical protein n=1 Tax=Bacillus cereus group sp. BfR-BA-01524 TaxID=2920372 RepID=UPI001F567021